MRSLPERLTSARPVRTMPCALLLPADGWSEIWPDERLWRCCANILKHRRRRWDVSFGSIPTAHRRSSLPSYGCEGRTNSWLRRKCRQNQWPLNLGTSMRTTSVAHTIGTQENIFADAEA